MEISKFMWNNRQKSYFKPDKTKTLNVRFQLTKVPNNYEL